jgi:hypothetical protein
MKMRAITPLSGTAKYCPDPDICPQNRTGGEVTQAMLIMGQEPASQIALCLKAALLFLMNAFCKRGRRSKATRR